MLLSAYSALLRPPLLPEDLRLLGATAERFAVGLPRLEVARPGVRSSGRARRRRLACSRPVSRCVLAERGLEGYELVLLALAGLTSVAALIVNFALASVLRWLLVLPAVLRPTGVALTTRAAGPPADAKSLA